MNKKYISLLMNSKVFLSFIVLIFLGSCQNRNQVTHNKRKYRKGYYKPNRAKISHRKSKAEEEVVYQSGDNKNDKVPKAKKQNKVLPKKTNNQKISEDRQTKELYLSDDNSSNEGQVKDIIDEKQKNTPNNDNVSSEEEEYKEVEKSKIAFWITLVFTFLAVLTAILLFVLIDFIAFGLAALIGGTIIIGLSIWLMIEANRDGSRTRKTAGIVFLIIGIMFVVFGAFLFGIANSI